jgi:hypothetical protein
LVHEALSTDNKDASLLVQRRGLVISTSTDKFCTDSESLRGGLVISTVLITRP